MKTPQRVVCLTEESVEILYLLGKEKIIKGVSVFVKRPAAAQKLPKVTQFTRGQVDKICSLRPDLVLGFSDIQKDLARDLIGAGLNVWIANQRSLGEILNYTTQLGYLVGEHKKTDQLVKKLNGKIQAFKNKYSRKKNKPNVYFEEWDDPQITCIEWVSELIELAGGKNIFKQKSSQSLALKRVVTSDEVKKKNPDIILPCWCGKKFNAKVFSARSGWDEISAIKNQRVYELQPEIFLQPGPAPILDGLNILEDIFNR